MVVVHLRLVRCGGNNFDRILCFYFWSIDRVIGGLDMAAMMTATAGASDAAEEHALPSYIESRSTNRATLLGTPRARKRYPLHTVLYSHHPTALLHGWRRAVRVMAWYNVLAGKEREEMDDRFPQEWENEAAGPTTNSTSPTGSPHADTSEVVVHQRSPSVSHHDLAPLYISRLSILNSLISNSLSPTRTMLVLLEIFDFALLILFIAALIVDQGQQAIFLEACELLLVVSILVHAAAISVIRVSSFSSSS